MLYAIIWLIIPFGLLDKCICCHEAGLTRRLPGLFLPSVYQGGGRLDPLPKIARMLPDFYHLWLIRSGSTSSRGGTKKNFGF